jgi:hypothetical protein
VLGISVKGVTNVIAKILSTAMLLRYSLGLNVQGDGDQVPCVKDGYDERDMELLLERGGQTTSKTS